MIAALGFLIFSFKGLALYRMYKSHSGVSGFWTYWLKHLLFLENNHVFFQIVF